MTDVSSPAPPASTGEQPVVATRRRLSPGRVGLAVYVAVLLFYCATEGLPMDRIGQTGWILIGMVAAKLGQPWREHLRTFLDWLPLLAALVLYDHTRGIADTLGMPVRVGELVEAEQWLFGGAMPTVWLQQQLFEASVRWWDVAVAIVYFTHFVVPWLVAAVFYVRSRPLWAVYIRRVLLLSYAGLLTYVLLPAAPPWFASAAGEISEPVGRLVGRGWGEVGLRSADAWLSEAQADVNAVAALPSLHAGFSMLVAVTLWPLARHWALRVIVAAFPLAMAFSLVYGGEHYMVDVLLGWCYVALVVWLDRLWRRRRAARQDQRDQPQPVPSAADQPA